VTLPTLKRVLCAGAPVPADLWSAAASFLTGGKLLSPYGATEALPISSVSADEIDPNSTAGACVGRAVQGIDIRIIPISDQPISTLDPGVFLAPDEVGEIIVRGAVVTKRYDGLPEATTAAKIPDPNHPEGVWHRMGDCGRIDASGRLWFLGRKVERVQTSAGTLFTEPCEQVFRAHPRARRCALVSVGGEPALVAETKVSGTGDAGQLAAELRTLALKQPHTATIKTFYFRADFPVDVRHNAKIHRLTLAAWAAGARPHHVP
jgi:acyl-CoA synthetase (AMP-forming)/AMP-acid ligase II